MNGTLKLTLRSNKHYTVIGGPFHEHIEGTVGVKMAKELDLPCDINIPTVDFSVPKLHDLDDGLERAVRAILAGHPVYVGCMAGRGRTGLFLAVLAKTFGEDKPVEYVRAHYYQHAVETKDQYAFVMKYQVPQRIKKLLFWARVKSHFTFKKSLTNMGVVG